MPDNATILTKANFMCLLCEEVAGEVRVVQNDLGVRFERGSTSFLIEDDKIGAHMRALHDNDIRALFGLNLEYTPFYCPKCDACFCSKHWRIWQELEDDGWTDCVRGTCPNGHTRMLED